MSDELNEIIDNGIEENSNDENKHSVVETRFTMDELDRLADEAKKQKDER